MVSRIIALFKGPKKEPDCPEVRNLSSDYIDGDLDQSTADAVKSHLDWCPPCQAFVKTLRSTVDLLRSIPNQKAPGDFRQRVRESLRRPPSQ